MTYTVSAELVANVLSISVEVGEHVEPTTEVALLDSMKMEIPVLAEVSGTVAEVVAAPGDVVRDGDPLVIIRRA